MLRGDEKKRLERKVTEFRKSGVPDDLAEHAASLLDWYSLLDIVDIATDTGREPDAVAPLYYLVSERFGIDTMLGKVTRLPRDDRWDALARGALRDDLYSVLESLTRAVIATGYDRDIEVEIFNADIWADDPANVVRRTAETFGAAVSPHLR